MNNRTHLKTPRRRLSFFHFFLHLYLCLFFIGGPSLWAEVPEKTSPEKINPEKPATALAFDSIRKDLREKHFHLRAWELLSLLRQNMGEDLKSFLKEFPTETFQLLLPYWHCENLDVDLSPWDKNFSLSENTLASFLEETLNQAKENKVLWDAPLEKGKPKLDLIESQGKICQPTVSLAQNNFLGGSGHLEQWLTVLSQDLLKPYFLVLNEFETLSMSYEEVRLWKGWVAGLLKFRKKLSQYLEERKKRSPVSNPLWVVSTELANKIENPQWREIENQTRALKESANEILSNSSIKREIPRFVPCAELKKECGVDAPSSTFGKSCFCEGNERLHEELKLKRLFKLQNKEAGPGPMLEGLKEFAVLALMENYYAIQGTLPLEARKSIPYEASCRKDPQASSISDYFEEISKYAEESMWVGNLEKATEELNIEYLLGKSTVPIPQDSNLYKDAQSLFEEWWKESQFLSKGAADSLNDLIRENAHHFNFEAYIRKGNQSQKNGIEILGVTFEDILSEKLSLWANSISEDLLESLKQRTLYNQRELLLTELLDPVARYALVDALWSYANLLVQFTLNEMQHTVGPLEEEAKKTLLESMSKVWESKTKGLWDENLKKHPEVVHQVAEKISETLLSMPSLSQPIDVDLEAEKSLREMLKKTESRVEQAVRSEQVIDEMTPHLESWKLVPSTTNFEKYISELPAPHTPETWSYLKDAFGSIFIKQKDQLNKELALRVLKERCKTDPPLCKRLSEIKEGPLPDDLKELADKTVAERFHQVRKIGDKTELALVRNTETLTNAVLQRLIALAQANNQDKKDWEYYRGVREKAIEDFLKWISQSAATEAYNKNILPLVERIHKQYLSPLYDEKQENPKAWENHLKGLVKRIEDQEILVKKISTTEIHALYTQKLKQEADWKELQNILTASQDILLPLLEDKKTWIKEIQNTDIASKIFSALEWIQKLDSFSEVFVLRDKARTSLKFKGKVQLSFEQWKTELQLLREQTLEAFNSNQKIELQVLYPLLKELVEKEIVTLRVGLELLYIDNQQKTIETLKTLLMPSFIEFQRTVIKSLEKSRMSGQEKRQRLKELKDSYKSISDALWRQGRENNSNLSKLNRQETLIKGLVEKENDHLEAELLLAHLLRSYLPQEPKAQALLKALEDPSTDPLWQAYREDLFLNTKTALDKTILSISPQEVIQDLNQLIAEKKGLLKVTTQRAKKYLRRVSGTCTLIHHPDFSKKWNQQYATLSENLRTVLSENISETIQAINKYKEGKASLSFKNSLGRGERLFSLLNQGSFLDWLEKEYFIAFNFSPEEAGAVWDLKFSNGLSYCASLKQKAAKIEKKLEDTDILNADLNQEYWTLVRWVSDWFYAPEEDGLAPFLMGEKDRVDLDLMPVDNVDLPIHISELIGRSDVEILKSLFQFFDIYPLESQNLFLKEIESVPFSVKERKAWIESLTLSQRREIYGTVQALLEQVWFGNVQNEISLTQLENKNPFGNKTQELDAKKWLEKLQEKLNRWNRAHELMEVFLSEKPRAFERLSYDLFSFFVTYSDFRFPDPSQKHAGYGKLERIPGDLNATINLFKKMSPKQKMMVVDDIQARILEQKIKLENKALDQNIADDALEANVLGELAQCFRPQAKAWAELAPSQALDFYVDYFIDSSVSIESLESRLYERYMAKKWEEGGLSGETPYTRFVFDWEPGKKTQYASDFKNWIDWIENTPTLDWKEKRIAPTYKKHLWHLFSDIKEFKKSPLFENIFKVFEKADEISELSKDEGTYLFFLALLNWNLNHNSTAIHFGPQFKPETLHTYYLNHEVKFIVDTLGLDLRDPESWKTFLSQNARAPEVEKIARAQHLASSGAGQVAHFSTRMEVPAVENPLELKIKNPTSYKRPLAKYNYRPVPLISENERLSLAPEENSFESYWQKLQEPQTYEPYRHLYSDRNEEALYSQLSSLKHQMVGQKDLTINLQNPYARMREVKDWSKFVFGEGSLSPASKKTLTQEALLKGVSLDTYPHLLDKVFYIREAYVDARRTLSELQVQYPFESYKIAPTRGNTLQIGTYESGMNAVIKRFAEQLNYKGSIEEIDVTANLLQSVVNPIDARRYVLAKGLWEMGRIANVQLYTGATPEEEKAIHSLMGLMDAHFNLEMRAKTYVSGLEKIQSNITEKLQSLCALGNLETTTDESKLKAAEEKIKDAHLMFLDNLMEMMENLESNSQTDLARRLLMDLVKKNQEKSKWIEYGTWGFMAVWIAGGLLMKKWPAMGRWAGKSAAFKFSSEMVSVLFGAMVLKDLHDNLIETYWDKPTFFGLWDTSWSAPQLLRAAFSIRDTRYLGVNELMSFEQAETLFDEERNVTAQQLSKFNLTMNTWLAFISVSMLRPAGKWSQQLTLSLLRGSAPKLTDTLLLHKNLGISGLRTGMRLSSIEKQKILSTNLPTQSMQRFRSQALEKIETSIKAIERSEGRIILNEKMASALDKTAEKMLKSLTDPLKLGIDGRPIVGKVPVKATEEEASQIRLLLQIRSQLKTKMPHVTADQLIHLLGKQSLRELHTPFLWQLSGIPFSPQAARALKPAQKAIQSYQNAHGILVGKLQIDWRTHSQLEDLYDLVKHSGIKKEELVQLLAHPQREIGGKTLESILKDSAISDEGFQKVVELSIEFQHLLEWGGFEAKTLELEIARAISQKNWRPYLKQLHQNIQTMSPVIRPLIETVKEVKTTPENRVTFIEEPMTRTPIKNREPYLEILEKDLREGVYSNISLDREKVIELVKAEWSSREILSQYQFNLYEEKATEEVLAAYKVAFRYKQAVEFSEREFQNGFSLFQKLKKVYLEHPDKVLNFVISKSPNAQPVTSLKQIAESTDLPVEYLRYDEVIKQLETVSHHRLGHVLDPKDLSFMKTLTKDSQIQNLFEAKWLLGNSSKEELILRAQKMRESVESLRPYFGAEKSRRMLDRINEAEVKILESLM